jgi:CheY-like chemotaxis protein
MQRVLSAGHIQALVVGNAEKALEVLQNFSPDILIVDMALPGMNGLQFLEIARQDPRNADIPAIAVTAFAKEFGSERAKKTGLIDGYMEKPVDVMTFLQRVQGFVNIGHIRERTRPCKLCGRSANPLFDVITSGEAAQLFSETLSESVIRRTVHDKRIVSLSSGRAWLLRYVEVASRWGEEALPPYRFWEGEAVNIACPLCERVGDPLNEVIAVTDTCVVERGAEFIKTIRAQASNHQIPSRKSGGTWLILRESVTEF